MAGSDRGLRPFWGLPTRADSASRGYPQKQPVLHGRPRRTHGPPYFPPRRTPRDLCMRPCPWLRGRSHCSPEWSELAGLKAGATLGTPLDSPLAPHYMRGHQKAHGKCIPESYAWIPIFVLHQIKLVVNSIFHKYLEVSLSPSSGCRDCGEEGAGSSDTDHPAGGLTRTRPTGALH